MFPGDQRVSVRHFLHEAGAFRLIAGFSAIAVAALGVTGLVHRYWFGTGWIKDPRFWFTSGILLILFGAWVVWTLLTYRQRFLSALQRRERQLLKLMEGSAEAVLLFRMDGRLFFMNPAAERLTGWTLPEAQHQPIASLIRLDAEAAGFQGDTVIFIDRNDGRHVVSRTTLELRNDHNEPELNAIFLRDLSEMVTRQAQMERSERLASLGHMAAGVAHEIGNPLASISGIIQLLQRRNTDPQVLELLSRVRQNIDRIAKIVRDMVDFSRPKSPEVALVQINDIVANAIGLVRHDARCRHIQLQHETSGDIPEVNAVADQLMQVFINLLLNAVDALEQVEQAAIKVQVDATGAAVRVVVRDNGKGIPKAAKSRIFEPFFTTKDPGRGTGLGLSVVHHILQACGASVRVDSRPGDTAFILEFPKAR